MIVNPCSFIYAQPEFVKTLSDILYHGGNSPVARMAAGLQLKNTLTSKDPAVKTQYQQRWLAFPEETRAYVKKNVMLHLFTVRNNVIFYINFWWCGEFCVQTIYKTHLYFSIRVVFVVLTLCWKNGLDQG